MPRPHERTAAVREAKLELIKTLQEIEERHDLTWVELTFILAETLQGEHAGMLRQERREEQEETSSQNGLPF